MKLPDTADGFIESAIKTGKQLIGSGIWEIQTSRFDSWIAQFCGKEEQFFAACLLDQMIFRSRPQFESALRSLFRSNVNHAILKDEHDLWLIDLLSSEVDPKIRLVPVICETDAPTKSGPLVLRRLQRILKLNASWMCWPWQVKAAVSDHGVHTVIFVDDFLGSGDQFEKFFAQWGFPDLRGAIELVYAPVVAHQHGLAKLSSTLPEVCVVCIEKLGDDQCFFNESTWAQLGQGHISAAEARDWYLNFGGSRGFKPDKVSLLGYGNLELALGFNHSTPNNSLPILWSACAGWQPLLER